MPAYERISAVVSVTLLGLALYFVLDFPTQVTRLNLFGSPLSLGSPQRGLMVLLLGGMAMSGADAIIRRHPALPSRQMAYLATAWMLPALVVVLATQTLGLAPSLVIWIVCLAGVGLLLWFTLAAEYELIASYSGGRLWAQIWQQFVAYVIALIFFIVIYHSRSRSAISATAVTLVGLMVALPLLRRRSERLLNTWLMAACIGLSLGQITWALNYWRTGALNAGLFLFISLYILLGISRQYLAGTLSRRSAWEFGAIGAVATLLVFYI